MNRWFGATIVIALLTLVILFASPTWLLRACNDSGDCVVVSAFLVGFVGALLSICCVVVGMLSSSHERSQ